MSILKKKVNRCVWSIMLTAAMLLGIMSPAFAASIPLAENQTAIVTMEYIDENGKAEYFLEPTQVEIKDNHVLVDVLNEAYQDKGEITYSAIYGFTVTPKDGEPVGEVDWGKKAWWPFANSRKVGNKYEVQSGEVIRFIYTQDNKVGFPGYVPPAGEGEQGSISVNKDKLIANLGKITEKQIEDNTEIYQSALAVAIDFDATQEAVNEQAEKIADILNQQVPATDITVSPKEVTLMVGETQQMTATLTPAESNDIVVWSSEDTDVVEITSDGLVYAVGAGKTTITAQANQNVKKTVEITVTGIPMESITLNKTSLVLEDGEGVRLTATVTPGDTTDKLIWTSDDETIASVDETGMVIAKKAGTATIQVVSGDKSASCTVTVTKREEATEPTVVFEHTDGRITKLDDNKTVTLSALDEGKFVVEGKDGNYTPYWICQEKVEGSESSNIYIASGGKFYPAIGEYPAYVYTKNPEWYDDAELIAEFTLKVVPSNVTELKLYMNGRELNTENPVQLNGTEAKTVTVKGKVDGIFIPLPTQALNATSTEGSYIYESFDEENALDFFAENQDMHTFTISMLDNPEIKVEFKATSKKIEVTGLTVTYPETFYINNWNGLGNQYVGITSHAPDKDGRYEINIEPYNATVKDVQWVSHNPEIAEFQETYNNGIVPKKAGTAKFTVTSVDNPAAKQEITIRFEYKNPLEKVELKKTDYTLEQYETLDLNLIVTPSNATNQKFVWTYSQEGIVKVEDRVSSGVGTMTTTHVLSALQQGTVTVTGVPIDDTKGANSIQFTVTVTEPSEVEDLDFDKYVTQNIKHANSYLTSELTDYYMYASEWSIFTILRSGGKLKQTDLNVFYNSISQKLQSGDRLLPTDYFRMVVALQVMGKDPTNADGINVIDLLCNYDNLNRLSSNMMNYTLMALDTKDYEVPEGAEWTRDVLIENILAFQNPENGGFGLSDNKTVGIDITAMTLQGLAPYNNADYPEVQEAIQKGLDYLRNEMTTDCGYFVEGDDNGCSAAQVLTALCTLGIDPLTPNNGFTKGSNNLVVKLDEFRLDDGFTTFMSRREPDGMAASKIGYALESYRRLAEGENSIFDLTDVGQLSQEEIDRLAAQEVMDLIGKIGTVTKDSKDKICAARNAYDFLTENQKKLVTNYSVLLKAEELYAQLTQENGNGSGNDNDSNDTQPTAPQNPETGDVSAYGFEWLSLTLSGFILAVLAKKVFFKNKTNCTR